MSADDIDNDLLISLVEARAVLWDKTLNVCKERDAIRQAWAEVCSCLKKDFDELDENEKETFFFEVRKRWRNLRDSFVKAEKKRLECKLNGSESSVKKKKYLYSEELQFLKKVYADLEGNVSWKQENLGELGGDYVGDESCEEYLLQPAISHVTAITDKKQDKKAMDDLDLLGLQVPEKNQMSSSRMAFFHSLMPYVETFSNNEMLEFQMGVLQVISNINNRKSKTS